MSNQNVCQQLEAYAHHSRSQWNVVKIIKKEREHMKSMCRRLETFQLHGSSQWNIFNKYDKVSNLKITQKKNTK